MKYKKLISIALSLLAIAAVLFIFLVKINFNNTWTVSGIFLYLIFTPGLFIALITKQNKTDLLLSSLIFGLIFHFLLSFISLIAHLSINQLLVLELVLLIALPTTYIITIFQKKYDLSSFKLPKIPEIKLLHIFTLVSLILSLVIVLSISIQGGNFRGDPPFHLTIMRKIVEGQPLSPLGLNYIKSSELHLAYGFPIWHILLSFFSKLTRIDIFTTWFYAALPLTIISLLIWWKLANKILPDKVSANFAYIMFLIANFSTTNGYIFTRLPVPDTLGQVLLLPLAILMLLNFLFKEKIKHLELIPLFLLIIFMALIHASQYIYLILIFLMFALFYLFLSRKQKNYTQVIKNIGVFFLINFGFIFIGGLTLEIHGHTFTNAVKALWAENPANFTFGYQPFEGVEIMAKYVYVLLPIIFLLYKRFQAVIFLIALLILMPLAYWGPVKFFLLKTIGFITLNRLYSNVVWDFFIWGLIISLLIIVFNLFVKKLFSNNRVLLLGLTSALILTFFTLIFSQIKNQAVSEFIKNTVLSTDTASFLNNHYLLLIGVSVVLSVILFLINFKKDKILEIEDLPQYHLSSVLFGLIIIFVFSSLIWENSLLVFNGKLKSFILQTTEKEKQNEVVNMINLGGPETVQFINKNIPPKSVFAIDQISASDLPLMTDQYMAAYPRTKQEKNIFKVMDNKYSLEEKIKVLKNSKSEYLFLCSPKYQGEQIFDKTPEIFNKIYNNDVVIYKINFN